MRKFIIQTFTFCIPCILLLIPPILVLRFSRENYFNIDNLIESGEKYFIGYAYNESNYYYLKWKEIESKPKHDVLVLGSSRVLQFRSRMFESSFYNAGFAISNISDFVPFLKSISKKNYPEILLIGLDQWMFNENWNSLNISVFAFSPWKDSFDKNASMNTLKSVWLDLFEGKYSFASLYRQIYNSNLSKIGLNSIVNDMGFRNDGSFFDGEQITKLLNNDTSARDYEYSETYSRMSNGIRFFEYGDRISLKALTELESLLKFCNNNSIFVVAILPPFADKVNEKIRSSGNYNYMKNIMNDAIPIFKKYGFELWDMTELNKFKSNDEETLDGFHGSEISYIKMLIYMLQQDSKLNEYANLHRLNEDLNSRLNRFFVYEY